ncbi:MAG: AI-2E family transporter [Acaryochloridaceae cyanobacterium CSU_3_4]|nr:AI-2E family transporter [Acaryochloris sp. SU_5_25]NJN39439.1 AI-2E family transporter [Acaryochloridaceae cyanobacterium CSU_3_4]
MGKSDYFYWWRKLSVPSRLLMIGLAAPILALNFWTLALISNYFGVLIGIVVVASLLAFLLNYPVSWCVQRGLRREPASIMVALLAISLLSGLAVVLFPVAFNQAQQLTNRLPDWFESGRQQLILLSQQVEEKGLSMNLDVLAAQTFDRLEGQLQALTKSLLNIALGTVSSVLDILIDVLVTVILTFYLLQHGDELWGNLINWLPERSQEPVSEILRSSFQNYFIGQLLFGICMTAALVPTFLILKVPFGLLFGLTIGTMALIPFGGTVGIILVTSLVALQNIWLGLKLLAAAVVVQQILDNLVAPRILGTMTGLNPAWVFISILIGAKAGGLIGVVIAVPMAVVIKTALVSLRSRMVANDPTASEVAVVATNAETTPQPVPRG